MWARRVSGGVLEGCGEGPDGDAVPEVGGGDVRHRRARCGRGGEGCAGAGDDPNLARLVDGSRTCEGHVGWRGFAGHAEEEQNALRTADDVREERERYVSFR